MVWGTIAIGQIRTGPMTFDGESWGALWFVNRVTCRNDCMWLGWILIIYVIIIVVPYSKCYWFDIVLMVITSSMTIVNDCGNGKEHDKHEDEDRYCSNEWHGSFADMWDGWIVCMSCWWHWRGMIEWSLCMKKDWMFQGFGNCLMFNGM